MRAIAPVRSGRRMISLERAPATRRAAGPGGRTPPPPYAATTRATRRPAVTHPAGLPPMLSRPGRH